MTTDLPARVAELLKLLEDVRGPLQYAYGHVASVTADKVKGDLLPRIDAALTGTGDDVLAVVKAAQKLATYDDFAAPIAKCPMCSPDDVSPYNEARADFAAALSKLDTEAAPTDGWIEWKGGEQPVPDGTEVRGQNAMGYEEVRDAERFEWQHTGDVQVDLVRYKLAGEGGM